MRLALLGLLMVTATPALAQRAAISADLAPSDVAMAFEGAVAEVCAPAVAKGAGVASLGLADRILATTDPATLQQAGAAPGEPVFDVLGARGVVTIRETAGRCVVSAYGPPAAQTIASVAKALIGPPGFQRMAAPAVEPGGMGETLVLSFDGRALVVKLKGSEPGMPGHQSRFSVVTATVFAADR